MSAGRSTQSSRAARQRKIVDHVMKSGFVSAADLMSVTGMSLMTVHRDIDELTSKGLLRKSHGGVSVLPTSVFESSAEFRMHRNVEAKQALARSALAFIEPGMSLMLDDSTTVFQLARLLPKVGPVTVLTNYRQIVETLKDEPDIRLIAIGGQYSRSHDSFIAPSSETGLDNYAVDIVFQSTSAMTESMTFHQEQEVVVMKRAMLAAGTRRVLLMDGTKVGRTSLHRFAAVEEFTDVVVTSDVPTATREVIGENSALHVADVTAGTDAW